MLSIVMMFFQGTIGKLLKDWRVIAVLLIGIIGIILYFKYTSLESNLKKAKEEVLTEQHRSQVLQSNWDQALSVNKQNEMVIAQLQVDRDNATQALNNLSASMEHTNKQLSTVRARIDNISVTPSTTISPYIVEAINGVQEMRESEQPASSSSE